MKLLLRPLFPWELCRRYSLPFDKRIAVQKSEFQRVFPLLPSWLTFSCLDACKLVFVPGHISMLIVWSHFFLIPKNFESSGSNLRFSSVLCWHIYIFSKGINWMCIRSPLSVLSVYHHLWNHLFFSSFFCKMSPNLSTISMIVLSQMFSVLVPLSLFLGLIITSLIFFFFKREVNI